MRSLATVIFTLCGLCLISGCCHLPIPPDFRESALCPRFSLTPVSASPHRMPKWLRAVKVHSDPGFLIPSTVSHGHSCTANTAT